MFYYMLDYCIVIIFCSFQSLSLPLPLPQIGLTKVTCQHLYLIYLTKIEGYLYFTRCKLSCLDLGSSGSSRKGGISYRLKRDDGFKHCSAEGGRLRRYLGR